MKKILLGVAAVGAVMLGANFYYTHQVEKHLESAAGVMRSMGGYLEYDDVTITLGGDVEIDRVRVMVPGLDESMNLDRIALRTDGILGVHQLAMDIRKKRLPAQLGLSFEGIAVPVGSDAYRQMNALANETSENLLTSGCGERKMFSDDDIAAMGFGELVKVNSFTEYRLMNEGQWVELESRTSVEGMNEFVMKMDFSLDAKSRDLAAISAAIGSTRFNEMVLDYQDAGYVQRIVDFCAKQMAMSKEEFIGHHLESWRNAWADHGFSPNDKMVNAYRKFLTQPDHFRLSIKPADDFSFAKLAEITPELLPYQFRTSVTVNGDDMGIMELSAAAKPAGESAVQLASAPADSTSAAISTPRRTRSESAPKAVSVEQLGDYLNQEVVLHLTSGSTLDGRIVQLSSDGLHIHSYQPTGYMTIPVNFAQISEAYVK